MVKSIGDIPAELLGEYFLARVGDANGPKCKHSDIEIATHDDVVPIYTVYGGAVDPDKRVIKDNNKRMPVYIITCANCGMVQMFSAQHVFDALVTSGRIDAGDDLGSDKNEDE